MNYEKKYKEALEIARAYHKRLLDEDNPEWASEIEKIFPELKESEDERIRKEILDYIDKTTGCKRWVAWLERQGEQKPDDRVEPKFRVGDWVMYKNGACFSDGSISARVRSIEGHKVWLEHGTWVDELELKKIMD